VDAGDVIKNNNSLLALFWGANINTFFLFYFF